MPRKKTHVEFVKEMKNISPDILIVGKYSGRHSPVEVKCLTCGKVWSPNAGDLLSGKGCRQCRISAFSKSRTKTHERFIEELQQINDKVEVLEKYVNGYTKLKTKCKVCGNIWNITPKDLLHGYGCKKCSAKRAAESRKITDSDYKSRIKRNNKNIEILGDYVSLKDEIQSKCKVCGNIWQTKASNLLYNTRCPVCSKERRIIKSRKSQAQFEKEVYEILPSVKIIGKYINIDTPIKCECEVCGVVWEGIPYSLINGHGCKRCSHSSTSFMEQFILISFIEIFGSENVLSRDKTTIGMELDILIPKLSIAIEPGSWGFHRYSAKRDGLKRAKCKEEGIRLITIYDSYPKDKEPPFEEDCIVFTEDYNTSNHSHIKNLVLELFRLIEKKVIFTNEQWESIEKRAYEYSRAKNTEEFIDELSDIRSDVEVLGKYAGSKVPIKTRCRVCGHIWNPRPANLLNNSGCPECSKKHNVLRQTKSQMQFEKEVKKIQPSIEILGEYIKGKAHIKAKCGVCGKEWYPVAAALLNGEGCPECGKIKKALGRMKTQEQYEKELFEVNPNLKVLGKYEGTTKSIRVQCKVCGYEWTRVARKLLENPHHRNEKKIHNKE